MPDLVVKKALCFGSGHFLGSFSGAAFSSSQVSGRRDRLLQTQQAAVSGARAPGACMTMIEHPASELVVEGGRGFGARHVRQIQHISLVLT